MLPSDPVPTKSKDESGVEALAEFLRKEGYTQSTLLNEMSRLDRQMEHCEYHKGQTNGTL